MVAEQVRVDVAVSGELRSLTSAGVAVSVRPVDAGLIGELSQAESELVAGATGSRQAEFATGRICARQALLELGIAVTSLGRGPRGEPLWPLDCIGSISHSSGIAAAVVARRRDELASIGIDLEASDSVEESLWPVVLLPAEQSTCRRSSAAVESATMFFAVKEALFKAQYPLDRAELDFLDVELSLRNPSATSSVGEFHIERVHSATGTSDLRPMTAAAQTTSGFVIAVVTIP